MKKIKYIIIIAIIFIITGCNRYSLDKIISSVKNFYNGYYNIEYISSYKKNDTTYVIMSANDTVFYVKSAYDGNAAGGLGNTDIETSILSSLYLKYKSQIELLAKKNNLNIIFNDYSMEDIFLYNNYTIEINTNISNIDNVKKFCEEVIEIEEINKIYNLVYGDGSYSYYELEMIGMNNSIIKIYDNENMIKSFSIFDEKFQNETLKINKKTY